MCLLGHRSEVLGPGTDLTPLMIEGRPETMPEIPENQTLLFVVSGNLCNCGSHEDLLFVVHSLDHMQKLQESAAYANQPISWAHATLPPPPEEPEDELGTLITSLLGASGVVVVDFSSPEQMEAFFEGALEPSPDRPANSSNGPVLH